MVETVDRGGDSLPRGSAMGLDKDDTIVKRRMAQKMEFLSEDVAAAHEPSTAELQGLVRQVMRRCSRCPIGPRSAICISRSTTMAPTPGKMRKRRCELARQPEDRRSQGAHCGSVHVPGLLRGSGALSTGEGIRSRLCHRALQPEARPWQGPIESGYGWHLIWIESIAPGKVPAFEEVEPDVKTAWLADQKAIHGRRRTPPCAPSMR